VPPSSHCWRDAPPFLRHRTTPAPTPTPACQKIDVISGDRLPDHYTVVGNVMDYSTEMLKNRARKLGADAIMKPKRVDPVSGWATTQAIKYGK
jgi:hypothetical protein